jgi:hypothetical protein
MNRGSIEKNAENQRQGKKFESSKKKKMTCHLQGSPKMLLDEFSQKQWEPKGRVLWPVLCYYLTIPQIG